VIDMLKEPTDVGFHDPSVFTVVEGFALYQTALARSLSRSVSDAFVMKFRFPNGLQNLLHGMLHDLIF
jgi:hypothetical protein